ncbi:Beauvericin cluster-specific repressor BEA4 [Lachnellula suecica]|uniref:Beauvericin cluster-specific repressor BEA4 n=1 Tax=Lachnellula suecica TaxID=602035 RepID=A0A8T9C885_9HELO|nr:Beauvericin cluster-specific repressor BEA4 [Lachnellula suecica]
MLFYEEEEARDSLGAMQASSKSESSKEKRERERKRLKKPKVKTGCKTCKIRRVKCDETRPECLRCQRFGKNYCDGYDYDSSAPSSRNQSRSRDLSSSSDNRAILARRSSSQLLEPMPQRSQSFSTEDEYRCFRLYCEEAAPRLSCFDRSVWQQLFLQPGPDQEFIRHALIAIGGLSRSMRKMGLENTDEEGSSTSNFSRLHGFALEHYDKFLAGTKRQMAVATREQGRQLAMISCLLVVCIENMQMHYQNALIHAQQSFKLVEELNGDDNEFGSSNQEGVSSNAIEDELVQQFNRMELQILTVHDIRTREEHQELKNEGVFSIRNMPETFRDNDEARWYLDLIMRRAFHFMAYAQADRLVQLKFRESPDEPSAFDNLEGLSQTLDASGGLEVEQEIYASESRRWSSAFEPLFHSSLEDINDVDAFRVLLMKVHSLTTTIRLSIHLSPTELITDSLTPQMESLIGMSRTILNHPYAEVIFGEGSFTFDMGLIYPLVTPAFSCRNRKLRRDALDLLCTRFWREAQWMSLISADMARFIMETEESGVETEYIPDWARVRLGGVEIVAEEHKGTMHCVRGVGESAVHIESVRDWSDLVD